MCSFEWSASPVAFGLFGLPIRWYALSYIVGFLFAIWWVARFIQKSRWLTKQQLDAVGTTALLALIVGGRLGYVIFYHPAYFVMHPLEIFYIWQGGMSFHGALIGIAFGLWWFARKHNIAPLMLGDLVASAAPVGLFLGRLANFANGELVGTSVVSTWVKWGVCFNNELFARHPSQIYEALGEGLLLFLLVSWVLRLQARKALATGSTTATFLIGYGIIRFLVEFVRQPDSHIGLVGWFSMGQWLCLAMVVTGGILWSRLRAQKS